MVTGGMDECVKIWEIPESIFQKKVKTRLIQSPIFSSQFVHKNIIDHVMWIGDLVLSKAPKCTNALVVCWSALIPQALMGNKNVLRDSFYLFRNYASSEVVEFYYNRFCVSIKHKLLMVGGKGVIYIFDLTDVRTVKVKPFHSITLDEQCEVRQLTLNNEESVLVCVVENSVVYRINLEL